MKQSIILWLLFNDIARKCCKKMLNQAGSVRIRLVEQIKNALVRAHF